MVKAPGSNKRVPKARDASEVMTSERPELRIIDATTWQKTQARLKAIHQRYTSETRGATRHRTNYLFSRSLSAVSAMVR